MGENVFRENKNALSAYTECGLNDNLLSSRARPAANLLLHGLDDRSGGLHRLLLLLLLLGAGSNQASCAGDGEDSDVLHNSN
ncbi:hypothetical protein HMPREF3039_02957 [Akkermansia sp. KLE1798]|nr:hypothetical protein HMPREF3039_02957 [Akkermansia sp. KLE1798]